MRIPCILRSGLMADAPQTSYQASCIGYQRPDMIRAIKRCDGLCRIEYFLPVVPVTYWSMPSLNDMTHRRFRCFGKGPVQDSPATTSSSALTIGSSTTTAIQTAKFPCPYQPQSKPVVARMERNFGSLDTRRVDFGSKIADIRRPLAPRA